MALTDRYRHGATLGTHVVTTNESAVTGYMVRVNAAGDKAWVGWDIGDVAMLNGTFLNSRATFGLFPLAFGPRGLYVMHADDLPNRRLSIYDLASRQWIDYAPILPDPLDPAPNPSVGSNGIAYIDPNGRAVMNYYPEVFERTMPNGERWRIIRETASYIVGGYGPPNDPRYGASLSRLHKPSGTVDRWLGATPIPHDALETPDGTLWTFISGTEHSPEPDAVVWQDFPTPPPIEPPPTGVRLPVAPDIAFPAPCRIGRAEAARAADPANAYWSMPALGAPTHPVMETAFYQVHLAGADYLCGLWLTDSPTKTLALEGLAEEIAYTKERGRWALNIHCDNLTHEPVALAAAKQVRLAGLVPILSSHAFDNPQGFEDQVRRFAAMGSWGISRGCRGKSADTMERADCLRREIAGCLVDFFLNWRAWPGIEPYMDAVTAQTRTPANYPGYVYQPPVPPTGQPTWPPADAPVKKKKGWRGTLG